MPHLRGIVTGFYYSMEDENSDQMYERMVYGIFHLKNPADVILRDSVLEGVIQKHFYRIVRKGDYFTLDIPLIFYGLQFLKETSLFVFWLKILFYAQFVHPSFFLQSLVKIDI